METMGDELRRGFGFSTATYVVMASMVGVGILTTSGYIMKDTGSQTLMLVLWLVGGVVALCGALAVAELAAAMPSAGGEYVFIRQAYGRVWAFLYGWVSFVIGFSAPTAMVAHGAGKYLAEPWLGTDDPHAAVIVRVLAATFIVLLTFVHMRGHSPGARVQGLTTMLKLGALLAIVAGGLVLQRGDYGHLGVDCRATDMPWGALGISLVYVMFSYSGWNAATYLAGEVNDPERVLPRALLVGCGTVIVLYLLLNIIYVYALPAGEVMRMSYEQVEPIAALAAGRLFGPWVAAPLSVAIGVGLLASLSAFILTGPRVYYAMARDGLFPAFGGHLNPSTRTPNMAIMAQAVCSLVLLFSGTFRNILTYTGVGLSVSSFFVVLAVFVLRIRRPEMNRPFKVPVYPIVPLLFLGCSAWMIVFAFMSQTRWSVISICTILCGIPIYSLWRRVSGRRNSPASSMNR